jgi:ABC-type transporter Mla subunit MlaD
MRLPVPGPRDVLSALERGGDQVEALIGAVPRMLALLGQAEVLVARASAVIDRVEAVAEAAAEQIDRVGTVVDDAKVQIDRVGNVADDAKVQIERVGNVVDGAQERIDSVGAVVDGAAVQVGRAASLMDVLEPPLTTLQPTLQTLADTTSPAEVEALVRLVDQLPSLTDSLERDVMPVLATLGSVAPDVHELLNVSRELNEILGKIPGIGRLKRRVEEGEDEGPGR